MKTPTPIYIDTAPASPVCYYAHAGSLHSRSVGHTILTDTLAIAPPPASLLADWQRDICLQLGLVAGEVQALSLARARFRWPDYRQCVQAVAGWLQSKGLGAGMLETCDTALMACCGAHYHHDGQQYGGFAFCNLFLTEDKGLDLHFASTGKRIPLVRGTVVVFDTCLPHAVIPRQCSGFAAADFAVPADWSQVFLTWELPIAHPPLAQQLGLALEGDGAEHIPLPQLRLHGSPAVVCPQTGRWLQDA